VAAGIDVLSTGTALFGVYGSLESAELEEETRTSAPLNVSQTAFGLYGGWINGNLAINGAASFGNIDFTSDRKIEIGSAFRIACVANWSGQSYTAGARATYTLPMGWLDVKPFVAADYIGFNQDGYEETAATNENLAITAGDSDASLATAAYGVSFVGNLGGDDAFTMKPQLSVGYRNVLNWENSPAALRFAGNSTGTTFELDPGVEPEDAIVAGLGLNIDSQFLNVKLGYDAEDGRLRRSPITARSRFVLRSGRKQRRNFQPGSFQRRMRQAAVRLVGDAPA
jgi:outer membrane autotransporter protein